MEPTIETLRTARLQLRPFVPADEAALGRMMSDPAVMRQFGGGVTLSPDDVRRVMEYHLHCRAHDYWAWAIRANDDHRFIGSLTAGMTDFDGQRWFEPAWILVHAEWGHGFATEAARAVVDYALGELRCQRLLATADPLNAASIRVIEKAGFQFLRQAEVRPGRPAKVFIISTASHNPSSDDRR